MSIKKLPEAPTTFILKYLQRFKWLTMINIKFCKNTGNSARGIILKKATTELDVLEVLDGRDLEYLRRMLADEVGVDVLDIDTLHVLLVQNVKRR
jgi:hypothetical protein